MAGLMDLLGAFVGFILTICVFSYIFGDNFLFRVAIHVFIGVAAAFAAVMVGYNVIWAQLLAPLLSGQIMLMVPMLLGALLLAKAVPRLSSLGSPVMAFLVGVGAAAAIGGAVLGTIFPQVEASANVFALQYLLQSGDSWGAAGKFINGGFILVGTLTTLVYFNFGVRSRSDDISQRPLLLRIVAWVGQAFIAVTFGALFAGVYAAALTALVERSSFMVNFIKSLIFPGT